MHTPGPWKPFRRVDKPGAPCAGAISIVTDPDGDEIAHGRFLSDSNARLIAAAPEMLALLTDWPINMPAEAWNRWHTERRALLARIAGES